MKSKVLRNENGENNVKQKLAIKETQIIPLEYSNVKTLYFLS